MTVRVFLLSSNVEILGLSFLENESPAAFSFENDSSKDKKP